MLVFWWPVFFGQKHIHLGWLEQSFHTPSNGRRPARSSHKKRKGGNQQRLKALEREVGSTAASVKGHSLLADWLKKQWAWGELSPQTVQQISSLAKKDMQAAGASEIPQDLVSLSMLGSQGTHPNNCHRDLMSLVADASYLPKPLQVAIPMKIPGGQALQSIMLPHEVAHAVWVSYPAHWENTFLPGGKGALVEFWKKFQHHPAMQDHWLLDKDDWMASTIPASLHGDAVPTVGCGKVWAKLMQCYSWSSLLSLGTTKQRSTCGVCLVCILSKHTSRPLFVPLCGCRITCLCWFSRITLYVS